MCAALCSILCSIFEMAATTSTATLVRAPRNIPPCHLYHGSLSAAQAQCAACTWCGGVINASGAAWCDGLTKFKLVAAAGKVASSQSCAASRTTSSTRPDEARRHRHHPRWIRIALCVLGEVRTLTEPAVFDSQQTFVLSTLRAQGVVEAFAVAAPTDDVSLLARAYNITEPARVRTLAVRSGVSTPQQFVRFATAYSMVLEAEAVGGWRYDFLVRLRPDTLWWAPIPDLRQLDAGAVHARMRCSLFGESGGVFRLNMLGDYSNQHAWRTCTTPAAPTAAAASPSTAPQYECSCLQTYCGLQHFVMDDQVMLVPRVHAKTVFNLSVGAAHNLIRRLGLCPGFMPEAHCEQTAWLVERRVRILPAALGFSIARATPKYGKSATAHGKLFLDHDMSLALQHGDDPLSCSLASVSDRAVAHLSKSY